MLSLIDPFERNAVWSQNPTCGNLVLKATLPSLKGISPRNALQSVDFPEPTGPTTDSERGPGYSSIYVPQDELACFPTKFSVFDDIRVCHV